MHVAVNVAMSIDGKISSNLRERVVISGPSDFERVEVLRSNSDAIMVGVQTVISDDPKLLLDGLGFEFESENGNKLQGPARVIIDSLGRTPNKSKILKGNAPTYIVVSKAITKERIEELRHCGAEVIVAGHERVDLKIAIGLLGKKGIKNILVEGGGELIFGLIEEDIVDELTVYISPIIIGGRDAPTLADGRGFMDKFPRFVLKDIERRDDGIVLNLNRSKK
jgi:2,5-diamino-6-(ribosylamino)-4(3H)-pyrimidinone 5'-phosphate reductase